MRDDRTTKPSSPADEAAGIAARTKGGCARDAKAEGAVHDPKGDSGAQPGRTHFMYVLRCADQTLYTGYTTDVAKRLATHNAGNGAKYTAARRPVVLEACASFPTKHAAMSAEYHFKRLSREAKLHVLTHAEDDAAFAQALTQLFDLSG